MERRDYILDEIQKFGQMVIGLIGKLVQNKRSQQYDFNLSMADLEFESEAGFTLKMLIEMDSKNLDAFLANHHELNSENIELLADLLIEISDDPGIVPRLSLARARDLLQIVDLRERTYAVERAGKLEFIAGKLKSNL
ncbi:MAG: hypothetical protein NTV01_05415 [Bacteroidia bacterium]|nr:hypothetical protein [Bacteroidia bacterium]